MAESFNFLRPPKPLVVEHDKDMAKEWKLWRQQYEYFETATGLSEKPENIQLATFMSAIGYTAIQIFNSFPTTAEDTVALVKGKFEKYFTPKLNITFERFKFHKIMQEEGETVDEYMTRLRLQANNCNFGELNDSLLRDQLVLGIKSDRLRTKLLSEDVALERALQICQATELANKQTAEISNEHPTQINAIQKMEKQKTSYDCRNCGRNHPARKCPAFRHVCKLCKKPNHYECVCRSHRKNNINYCAQIEETNSIEESEAELFIGSIQKVPNTRNPQHFTETITLEGKSYQIKLDTGAQCNVLPKHILDNLTKQTDVRPSNIKYLVSFGNHKLNVLGEIQLKCTIAQNHTCIIFKIVQENVQPILGAEDCEKLRLIQRIYEVQSTTTPLSQNLYEGLGCINSFVYDIDLIDKPQFEIIPARRIAYKIREQVKNELDTMVKLGVIERTNKPTPAVSPMIVIRKNDKIRICMDPTSVNKNIKRRHYPMNTLEEIAAQLKGAKYFTILDCKRGFWQIPVSDRTKEILTFSTPWGRYSCKRLPFGISSAPEVFQNFMQQLFSKIPNVKVAVDDILIHGASLDELKSITAKVIKILQDNGMKLNKEKCYFEKRKVKFLGHVLSDSGLAPDPDKVDAVKRLKPPTNRKELQRLLGKFTYLSKFIKNFSNLTAPMRELLEKKKTFDWGNTQQHSLDSLKEAITKPPVLKLYDVNEDVKLQVDASSYAIGAVLIQQNQPVAYASKALTDCQTRYSQLEKEALAIQFGCEKFHQYVWGKQLTVESDHKPLQSIFQKPLHSSPTRLQKIRLSLLTYNPNVVYKPGSEMFLADPLSRDCQNIPTNEEEEHFDIQSILCISKTELDNLKNAIDEDQSYRNLTSYIKEGWPSTKNQLPADIQLYWHFREELTVDDDGIIYKSSKVLIPKGLRSNFLKHVHKGHFSYSKCVSMARQSIFWPKMSSDIFEYIKKCAACQVYQHKNTKIIMGEKEIPSHGFDIGAADLFHFNNQDYIVFIDSYTGYLNFKKLKETTSNQVILFLKEIFSTFGTPLILETDNGPQFTSSEFKKFSTAWKFNHRTSSPYHPSGNGLAEKAVQIAKNILKKSAYDNSDPFLGILNYMNTPRGNLGSPSQRLFGHEIRGLLPIARAKLSNSDQVKVSDSLKCEREKQKEYADRGAKALNDQFERGDKVVTRVNTQDTWKPAVIKSQEHPRSYIIQDDQENTYRRNVINIRPTLADFKKPPEIIAEGNVSESTKDTETKSSNHQEDDSTLPLRRSSRIRSQPQRLQYCH